MPPCSPAVVAETPATEEATKVEDKKPEEKKANQAIKVGRRLSARVNGFFSPKKTKEDAVVPAKVDEGAPQIEEPAPVAPLEDSAAKKEEGAPTTTPVVAAAA